jgi:nucleotide-binding universal stress UspA family protein
MRLLVAVDLNDTASDVLATARTWAERLSATLDVVYVDEHSYNAYLVQDPSIQTVLEREWGKIREHQLQRLHELVNSLPEGIRGEALLVTGRASEEIVAAAAGRDALLMATHGRRGFSHAVMGSVAERVVRTSPIPVMVFPLRPAA